MADLTETERLAKQIKALQTRVRKLENRIKGYDKAIAAFTPPDEPEDGPPWTLCRRREREQQHLSVVPDDDGWDDAS